MTSPIEDVRMKEWAMLPKHDPADYLRSLLALIARGVHAGWEHDPDKRERLLKLRGQGYKKHRELRDACLFCIGMRQWLGLDLKVIHDDRENSAADAIAFWRDGDMNHYAPLQLKELVPWYLNPFATLDGSMRSFRKYGNAPDTIGVVFLNRKVRLEPDTKAPGGLGLGGLWLFGRTSPRADGDWILYGNLMEKTSRLVTYRLNL